MPQDLSDERCRAGWPVPKSGWLPSFAGIQPGGVTIRACWSPTIRLRVQPVIAERQVAGQLEGRLTDQPADRGRTGECGSRAGVDRREHSRPPIGSKPDRLAVGNMHPERRLGAQLDRRWSGRAGSDSSSRARVRPATQPAAPRSVAGTPSAASTATNCPSAARRRGGPTSPCTRWRPLPARQLVRRVCDGSGAMRPILPVRIDCCAARVRVRHRGSAGRPRCPGEPPGVPYPRGRTPREPDGRRCTGWTSCSSRHGDGTPAGHRPRATQGMPSTSWSPDRSAVRPR